MRKIIFIISLLCWMINPSVVNSQTKTLNASTNQQLVAQASSIYDNEWTPITSTPLTLTAGAVKRVLVEATIEVNSQKKDIEGKFRLTDGINNSQTISRFVKQKAYDDKGLVAISFIFNYDSSSSGVKTFTLQHSKVQTNGKWDTVLSKAIITAIEIERADVALPNAQGSNASVTTTSNTFSEVAATNAIVLENQANIYIVSTFSTGTTNNAEATGGWSLRESLDGGSTYTPIDDSQITRTILDATSIGAATIVTMINRPAGTYNFELAHHLIVGSAIITSGATISAVALTGTVATGGDVFAAISALNQTDDNTTNTYEAIIAKTISPPSNADNQLFMNATFNMTATGGDIAFATYQFKSNGTFTPFEIQRYVPAGKIGSGGLIGIVTGLTKGNSYDVSFEHKDSGASGNTLTTENVNAIGFYLNSSPKFTWVGVTDTAWNTASNWDLNLVPAAYDVVHIPSGITNYPIISNSDNNCYDLTIDNGASLTVNAGQDLTIRGNLNQAGSLTLASTSTTYASLIVHGTTTGTINYKRYTNVKGSATTGGNDLVSPPVSGQQFGDFATANLNLTASGVIRAFAPFNNATNAYENYRTTTNATTILESGKGFRAATDTGSTLTFSGTVLTGNVNIAITDDTNDWNLIGNPYPSYLDFATFFATNKAQFEAGAYQAVYGYDGQASDGWTIWNQGTTDDTQDTELITPGQGFYVKTITGGGSVLFTPIMRKIGTSDDFILGKSAKISTEISNTNVKIQISDASKTYKTAFYFNDNASLGLDPGYDAGLYEATAPAFSIYSHLVQDNTGIPMAIQSLNPLNVDHVNIPLGINATAGKQLTVSIAKSTLPAGIFMYLEDNVTGEMTLLNEGDYTFTANENLTSTGRFYVSFKTAKVLAIEDQLQQENSLQLYTTPSNVLFVNGQINETTSIHLFDIQGRKMMTRQIEANNISTQIDLSQFNSGIYIVQVKNNLVNKTKKVIIR